MAKQKVNKTTQKSYSLRKVKKRVGTGDGGVISGKMGNTNKKKV